MVPLRNQPILVKCLCKLHNFCIDENETDPPVYGPGGLSVPEFAHATIDSLFQSTILADQASWSTCFQYQPHIVSPDVRSYLADDIQAKGFARPVDNLVRNNINN
jgi:hypothetical protein